MASERGCDDAVLVFVSDIVNAAAQTAFLEINNRPERHSRYAQQTQRRMRR